MPWWSGEWHTVYSCRKSVRPSVCRSSPSFSMWVKFNSWNLQCKCNMMCQRKYIGGFFYSWHYNIRDLWSDLLTLMAVASNPESSEEQISCLSTWQFNLYSKSDILQRPSEIQRRRLLKLHSQSFANLSMHTTDCMQFKAQPNLAPTLTRLSCSYITISCYCMFFVYTNSCQVALLLLPANLNLYIVVSRYSRKMVLVYCLEWMLGYHM